MAARDAERVERVVGVELECLAGRGGRAEWTLHRGLVKAALYDRGVPARLADPEEYLGAERRGGEQSAAVEVLLLGHGQRRGDGDASGWAKHPMWKSSISKPCPNVALTSAAHSG